MRRNRFDLVKDYEDPNERDPFSVPIEEKPLSTDEEIACIKVVLDTLMRDFLILEEKVTRHLG